MTSMDARNEFCASGLTHIHESCRHLRGNRQNLSRIGPCQNCPMRCPHYLFHLVGYRSTVCSSCRVLHRRRSHTGFNLLRNPLPMEKVPKQKSTIDCTQPLSAGRRSFVKGFATL